MLGPGVVTLDLHGKNAHQARVAIDAALRRAAGSAYRLRIIHGHSHGTVLRDRVAETYGTHPGVLRLCRIDDSTTDLVLREL